MMLTELLTVEEVAERLKISRTAVFRLIYSKKLPACRFGVSTRIEASWGAVMGGRVM